jgi:hypothetical protein
MGRTAYRQTFELSRSSDSIKSVRRRGAWKELSSTFTQAMELIAYVADSSLVHNNKNLIGVYERWTKTKSKRLYDILVEAGIDPAFVQPNDTRNAS